MFVLVLNQKNLIPDGQNNKLLYRFPNSVNLKDKYIAVSSVSLFYSWDNISALLLNNKITYTWTVGTTTTPYTITIPDGLYEISEINAYCQFVLIANGHYWLGSGGTQNLYPFEIVVNPTRYAIQLNTFLVPILPLPVGITVPSNWGGYATQVYNSVVSFPAKFNVVVGYPETFSSNPNVNNTGTATFSNNSETKNSLGTFSYLSNSAPQVQPNSNVLLSLSGINNPYSQPSSIIYSLNPSVAVGQQITEKPPNFMWNKILDGTYSELLLRFLGTDLSPLVIKDPNMTILLTIRDKDESFMGTK
jgi:hypothetical protein